MKSLYGGHHRYLEIVSVIEKCPLHRGSSHLGLFCLNWLFRVLCNRPQGVKRLVLLEKRAQRKYIREHYVYLIIWKPLFGKCLQCVKEPTNEVDKNTVAMVCTNSHCKEGVVGMCNRNLHDCVPTPLRFGYLWN